MRGTTESEAFLSSREAAQLLGVSLRTVQLWVDNGTLRAWKTGGGHRRVVRGSVEALQRQQRAAIAGEVDGQPFTVLVVEDEPVQRELYQPKFDEWDLPVKLITTIDGFEGLLEIGRNKPDLIIEDLSMPSMDGFHMIRTIRGDGALRNTQLIVITGLSESEMAENGGLPSPETFTTPRHHVKNRTFVTLSVFALSIN